KYFRVTRAPYNARVFPNLNNRSSHEKDRSRACPGHAERIGIRAVWLCDAVGHRGNLDESLRPVLALGILDTGAGGFALRRRIAGGARAAGGRSGAAARRRAEARARARADRASARTGASAGCRSTIV